MPQLLRKKLRVEPMNWDKVPGHPGGGGSRVPISTWQWAGGRYRGGHLSEDQGDAHTLAIQLPLLAGVPDKLYLHVTGDEVRHTDALFTPHTWRRSAISATSLRDSGGVYRAHPEF